MVDTAQHYSPVTAQIVEELEQILGPNYVIYQDEERMEEYSHDETPGKQYAHMPDVVVRPRTANEIASIMKLANRENIPVTPRGAGSGLSGGAVPTFGGILLSVDRMNSILEIDTENLMVVVEPGVISTEINEALEPHGLLFAGYPMSQETCYIGGNVAENAGGGKAVKYGVTGRYVLGLEVITPTGEIVEMGGKLVKDVTGYNMPQLMVGSEGTLGIFSKIILKLMPLPKAQVDLLCLFPDTETALSVVPKVMTAGIIPTGIEFMDRASIQDSAENLNESLPYDTAGALLLITVDGTDAELVDKEYEMVGDICTENGALEVYVADNATNSRRIWGVRKNIGETYNLWTRPQSNEDLVVPPAAMGQLVTRLNELAAEHGVLVSSYGHAGDGNLHTRIRCPLDWDDARWEAVLPGILDNVYALVAELGGRISGEHGIGHKRKKYMNRVVSEEYINILRSIKRAMDPNNILNPGKIFDL